MAHRDDRTRPLFPLWLILEVGPDHIKSGKAMEWLQALFENAERKP
ncbi:MAG: hypothetical protein M0Z99_32225 [Betaproteobacteria bacterium]|nr:hypothetical protein [Betaproteobacteria bacterium]